MASKGKVIGSTDPTQPETAGEERETLPHSTREQEVRNRAYAIYLQRGGQPGHELEDWLRAERQMSTNLTAVLQELLQNTSNLKVLRQLMTPDATYVSLNFDNPELKKVMPWTGTHKGLRRCPMSLGQSNASGKHSTSRSPTPLSRVAAWPSSAPLPTNRT